VVAGSAAPPSCECQAHALKHACTMSRSQGNLRRGVGSGSWDCQVQLCTCARFRRAGRGLRFVAGASAFKLSFFSRRQCRICVHL